MKVENFATAVEFYSQAITINPHNAVYYCNRSEHWPISTEHTDTRNSSRNKLCVCV